MNDMIPKKTTFLVLPHPLVEGAKDKDKNPKATAFIKFVLKQRAGSTATAPTYKLTKGLLRHGLASIRPFLSFGDRTVKQANTQDRVANINTILQGDLLTTLEEKFKNSLLQ
jgi:hypothetical protein